MRYLLLSLLVIKGFSGLYSQTDFLDLSNKRTTVWYLGKSVNYGYDKQNLADTTFRSVMLNVKTLTKINQASLIEDINQYENIVYFRIDDYFKRGEKSDFEIPPFRELEHIRYFELHGKELNCDYDALFHEISLIPNLEYLILPDYKKISIDTLDSFDSLFRKVKGINFSDNAVAIPSGVSSLSEVVLRQGNRTLLRSLENLDKEAIRELKIRTDTITDDILSIIEDFSKLERLHIVISSGYHNKTSRMKYLGKLGKLEKMSMGSLTAQEFSELGQLQSLTSLSLGLDTFQTQDLSPIFELEKLKELQLSVGASKSLLWNTTANRGLEIFKVIGRVEKIGEELCNLTSLKNLDLSNNRLKSLPICIGDLEQLEVLNLKANELKSLPESFGNLKQLEVLDLSYNSLIRLPENFSNLNSLKELKAKNNLLNFLPEAIGELENLELLELWDNDLESIPNSIADCENLKSLLLSRNSIKRLPDDIRKLSKLELLALGNNHLKSFPKSIYALSSLEKLYLSNNQLEILPDGISSMKSLTTLALDNSVRTSKVGKDGLVRELTAIEIESEKRDHNNIKLLPQDLWMLPSISLIRLTGNQKLDENTLQTILKMKQPDCEVLMQNCGLQALPESGWQEVQLKRLDLSKNGLTSLPAELFHTSITDLDFRKNDLGLLDTWIRDQTNLKLYGYLSKAVTKQELIEQPELVETIMEIGARKYYYDRPNPILDIYPIAFELDSAKTASLIDHENYAEALFEAGSYEECIPHYTISIAEELAMCMTMVNDTYQKFYNRHIAYLETRDTVAAIGDLQHIETLLGRFYVITPEIAQLYAEQGNVEEYGKFMEKGIKSYENRWTDDAFAKLTDKLRLLELYVISGDEQKISALSESIAGEEYLSSKNELILEYLLVVDKVANGSEDGVDAFLKKVAEYDGNKPNWRCNLMQKWAATLSQEKRSLLTKLNQAICPE